MSTRPALVRLALASALENNVGSADFCLSVRPTLAESFQVVVG